MLCIKNGTIIGPDGREKADLYVENGRIAAVGGTLPYDESWDAEGCLLFPGFIDSHTHLEMNTGSTVTADSFASGTAAALAGGTTVILDFATPDRGHTLAEALEAWHSRADGHCACDYGFHMAVTEWNEATRAELADMEREGVTSFKAYMAYENLRLNDKELLELFKATADIGVVGVHCELGDEVNSRVARLLAEGKTLGRNLFFLFQPAEETGEGARRCLPFLQEEGIERIFGFHNIPGFPLGAVLCREGTFACASRGLTIRLTGKQSHAAYPELGANPAFLAAGLLEELPALLAPERWKGLVLATVVQVAVGEKAFGVSAGEGEVSLTLRAHLGEELEQLQEEIQAYVTREGARQGIASRFVVQDAFPHTASTPALEARLEDAWRRKGLQVLTLEEPMRWSEDFGWYLGQVPGVFFGIGAGEACPGLHTPDYSFPDGLLPAALKAGQTALLLE